MVLDCTKYGGMGCTKYSHRTARLYQVWGGMQLAMGQLQQLLWGWTVPSIREGVMGCNKPFQEAVGLYQGGWSGRGER